MLAAAERAQLVTGWNDTAAAVPAGSVPELIAARAALVPDAIAVCCGDAWVSYGELVERAARLGGYLRAAGAGPETVVGLCLDRGRGDGDRDRWGRGWPGRRTCRWIRAGRRSGWRSCWPTAGPRWW